ncbi:hypothetical protein C8R44DRAFT_881759 [Mycena epipterygia]|nr:hypothetical protein C8R44DRAFT_881759 [Mycena epipterygia]
MSKSRSVTPTPNTYAPINNPSTSGLMLSRPPNDDINIIPTATPTFQASPNGLIHRRPSPDTRPMAKRMRRQSTKDTSRSQFSDSPSGMADTENLSEAMSPYSETSPPSDNGTPSVDTGDETSNTAGMNVSMPTALERTRSVTITVYGVVTMQH